jgi:hypothetical protein
LIAIATINHYAQVRFSKSTHRRIGSKPAGFARHDGKNELKRIGAAYLT